MDTRVFNEQRMPGRDVTKGPARAWPRSSRDAGRTTIVPVRPLLATVAEGRHAAGHAFTHPGFAGETNIHADI